MAEEPEKDEHGLVVQKYEAMVLVVLPEEGFGEQTLRYARSCLFNVHVGAQQASIDDSKMINGALQDELQPDVKLDSSLSVDDFAGVIFAGGPGARTLESNADAQRLAKQALEAGKLVAAWGESVAILAAAGVLKGRKVTGHADLEQSLRAGGARYTGNQVETDGTLVTARDESAGMRFGRALVQVVAIL